MSFDQTTRRNVIARFGAGIAGVFAGLGMSGRPARAELFVTPLLQHRDPVRIPPGRYDDTSQLFVDTVTGEPVFARDPVVIGRRLTEADLAALLDEGTFIDASKLPVMHTAQSTTSTLTSLSTTSCCPIVTDETPDEVTDD